MNLSGYNLSRYYKLFVFDLDDTLYDEKDYLKAAYKAIAKFSSDMTGCSESEYFNFLLSDFSTHGRQGLFDRFLEKFDLVDVLKMEDLLKIMRNCDCALSLKSSSKKLLDLLIKNGKIVYVLTNGNIEQQKNKIKHLKIATLYPSINVFYALSIKAKPAPNSLLKIIQNENIQRKFTVMIGDSDVDSETAEASGVDYVFIGDIEDPV